MITEIASKETYSAIAIALTFVAFYPYIRSILTNQTRPHVFSWAIWGVGTVIVFIAQLSDGAGVGAWPIGLSALISLAVAGLAFVKRTDMSIVRIDWVFLVLAMTALPLWFITETALSAVIVLTIVDLLGFAPSIRKAWDHPREENALFFGLGALRNGFVLLALEAITWTTALFPLAVGIACVAFVGLILWRRLIQPDR